MENEKVAVEKKKKRRKGKSGKVVILSLIHI